MRQPVVVDFMHEREQATDLTGGDALTGKPVQVVSLLVHQQTPFVLAKGHLYGDQLLEILEIHGVSGVRVDGTWVDNLVQPRGMPLDIPRLNI